MADVDPRELTTGYMFEQRNLGTAWGVLRDGSRVIWKCSVLPGHRVHVFPGQAGLCAEAELERRREGAKAVLWLAHCTPCWAYWDLALTAGREPAEDDADAATSLLRGACPVCGVPYERVRAAILERQDARVR